ncbi:4-alpha-glucanotransferase [Robbsia sp. KACC 23696]|uniref:4-alpha-glucanotransferase n=1 Tax=Robbsia sp. KACC 23696 TaxID=3149231 RepID=UPI00325A91C2
MSTAPGARPTAAETLSEHASDDATDRTADPLAQRRAALAERAGFLVEWRDASDKPQYVAADVLAVLLSRIGLQCDTVAQCDASLAMLDSESLAQRPPPLLTGTVGKPLIVPAGWLQADMTYSIAIDASIPPGAWDTPEGLPLEAALPHAATRLAAGAAASSASAELAGTTVASATDGSGSAGSEGSDGQAESHLRTLRGRTKRADAPLSSDAPDATAAEYVAIAPIDYPGYHTLQLFDEYRTTVRLAIAPPRCFGVDDALATLQPRDVAIVAARPDTDTSAVGSSSGNLSEEVQTPSDTVAAPRVWGLTAQVYGLRPSSDEALAARDMGLGDFTMLAALTRTAAQAGAGALAISPLHAMSNADPGKYSPYSPSSRLFLNAWHVDPAAVLGTDALDAAIDALNLGPTLDALGNAPLIDWPTAVRARLAILRYLFDTHFTDLSDPADADGGAPPSAPTAHDSDASLRAPIGANADAIAAAAEKRAARAGFDAFRRAGGVALERHARFETLHAARIAAAAQQAQRHTESAGQQTTALTGDAIEGDTAQGYDWRQWPAALQDPESADVAAFVEAHRREVDFQLFLQWQASLGLARAQEAARAAGMPIGLIADLAVGCDSAGSQTWADPQAMLHGLSVGAPPDLFNREGQRWGLTTFSPRALAQQGFAPFIEMVRAALRHAGGLRVDHILGLRRLWLVPDGESASRGAYLRYPLDDLLRLLALESWRHRAIVIGEDLGTVPPGLRETLADAGLLGMRVLWFEREENAATDASTEAVADASRPNEPAAAGFTAPARWSRDAVAMTSTHDLPTLAGWWRGDDIAWRAYVETAAAQSTATPDGEAPAMPATDGDLDALLDRAKAGKADDMRDRLRDRAALWSALCAAGLTNSDAGATEVSNVPDSPPIDAMLRFVAATPAPLALLPLEDVLGLAEQPNLPGPSTVHPNWRRRMPYPIDRSWFIPDTTPDAQPIQQRLGDIAAARTPVSSS